MNWKGCGRKWCLERLRKTTRNSRSIQTWQRCSWGLHCNMYRSQCTVANCIKILRKSRSEYNVSVALPIRRLDTDYVANVEAIAVYFQTAALHCLTEFYMHCDPANFQWHWHIRIVSRIVPTAAKLLVCPSTPDMFRAICRTKRSNVVLHWVLSREADDGNPVKRNHTGNRKLCWPDGTKLAYTRIYQYVL
jgi:hypothetical protein